MVQPEVHRRCSCSAAIEKAAAEAMDAALPDSRIVVLPDQALLTIEQRRNCSRARLGSS
jgi:hypothetical protein